MKQRSERPWKKRELSLLGKFSDAEVARRLGLGIAVVRNKRHGLGIAPSRPRKPMEWGPEEVALLGKHPDFDVARMLGTYRKAVINKRHELGIASYARASEFWHTWTKKEIALLGTMSDRKLAERIGIQPMCVTSKRRLLKVPAFQKKSPARRLEKWRKADMDLLGRMSDREAAERLDLSTSTVRLKRVSLGIDAFGRGGSKGGGSRKRRPDRRP